MTNWTLVKSKLWCNDILEIPFSKPLANLENEEVNILDGGQAFAFKPDDNSKFLVGTDLGMVYYCTTEYCSEFLARFSLKLGGGGVQGQGKGQRLMGIKAVKDYLHWVGNMPK